MNKLLSINNVYLSFKKPNIEILTNINLFVERGRATIILGESGAGKSMLIKCVTNLINRNNMNLSGKCLLEAKDLFEIKGRMRKELCGEMALIMQNPMTSLNPSRKIETQILDILCATKKMNRKEAKQRAISTFAKLNIPMPEKVLTAYPAELSGGMLQRIMISIAIITNAKIIIGDEPTTALDILNQNIVLEELSRLKNTGLGLLLVTHDISVANKIGDYIAVMKKGEIVEFGPKDKVLHSPKHKYTQSLINASLFREEMKNASC